jgi:hypothetical protein
MQRRGVRVSVVSTVTTQPPMVADELRRQADEFLDLSQLASRIGRDPSDRPQRPMSENGERPRPQPRSPALESRYGIRQPQDDELDV